VSEYKKANNLRVQYRHRLRRAALRRRRGAQPLTPGIEDSFDTTLPMRTELDWLIYNAPLEYAQMALDGTLEQYLREAAGTHGLED